MNIYTSLRKKVISFFMIMVLYVTMLPATAFAAETEDSGNNRMAAYSTGNIIYTQFTGGNSNHSGDGSSGNPYNLFEDAYAAASDGDLIYFIIRSIFKFG